MNPTPYFSMVGLDPTTQWFSLAVLLATSFTPTTTVQMQTRDQVWVVGSSPTMERGWA